jgi:type I restriction enzyme S subunit
MIDVSPEQLQTIKDILEHHVPGCEVRAFGSRFTWTAKDYSDLDLAIVGTEKLPFKDISALKTAFEESDLPYRVDVLDWHAISLEFQQVIEQGYEVIQKPGLDRSSNWNKVTLKVTLKDAGVCLIDCEHKTPAAQGNGYPYIAIPQIKNGRIDLASVRLISREDFMTWTRKAKPQVHDVVLSRRCNPGETAFVPPNLEFALGQNLVLLRPDGEKLYPPFLRWLVSGPEWWNQIQKYLNAGAIFNSLKCADIPNFELSIPPLSIQRRIADILSALDGKIELNRQTNATLEAIAQAIFKEWFVDFNFPGATGEMVESELGMIPRGWRAGRLGDICNVTMGQSPPGESYNETGDGIPFYQGRTDFGFRFPTQRVFTIDAKRFAKQFDTLVSVRAPVGDMNIATENCCIGRGLASVIEKNGNYSFTYYSLRELTEKFKSFEDNGTVFGSINKTDFENMLCIVPNTEAISAFEDKCRSIDENIFNNEKQSVTLVAIRDALLPKLMSGEIEV